MDLIVALESWRRQVLLARQDFPTIARITLRRFQYLTSTVVVWAFQLSFSYRIIPRKVAVGVSSPALRRVVLESSNLDLFLWNKTEQDFCIEIRKPLPDKNLFIRSSCLCVLEVQREGRRPIDQDWLNKETIFETWQWIILFTYLFIYVIKVPNITEMIWKKIGMQVG